MPAGPLACVSCAPAAAAAAAAAAGVTPLSSYAIDEPVATAADTAMGSPGPHTITFLPGTFCPRQAVRILAGCSAVIPTQQVTNRPLC